MKQYQKSEEKVCRVCGEVTLGGKSLSNHIRSAHNLDSQIYTVQYILNGITPICPICGVIPRYVAFSFKTYCKNHSSVAAAIGGKKGGQAEAWNKGLTKETSEKIAQLAMQMTGSGNPFFGRKHTSEALRKMSDSKVLGTTDLEKRIFSRSGEFEIVTPLDEYRSRQCQYLEFKCRVCGTIQPKTLQAYERGSRCYKCHPESKSNWEIEVYEYIKSKFPDAITGDRKILSPKEIDIFVPSKSTGIECHGLYWHSESCAEKSIDKRSHINKLELASSRGVKLYQFFYDEWRDKREIVQSMIDHRLGVSNRKIFARKTSVICLDQHQQRSFFNYSHLAGYVPARYAYGLEFDGELVAALSSRSPRQKKWTHHLEIARFATLPGVAVIGGLQRLISKAVNQCHSDGVDLMTYVDRRIGDGHGYLNCGFSVVGDTGIDYWYTDNTLRYDRFKFKAANGLSEADVAAHAKVSRIWGCGSLIMRRVISI